MRKRKGPTKADIVAAVRAQLRETEQQMQSHIAPPKRHTKTSTKATVSSFRKNLEGVPGGGIWKMAEAQETGTRLAGPTVLRRLQRSPQNCNTTKGNYII